MPRRKRKKKTRQENLIMSLPNPFEFLKMRATDWFGEARNILIISETNQGIRLNLQRWLEEDGKKVSSLCIDHFLITSQDQWLTLSDKTNWALLPQFQVCFILGNLYAAGPCPVSLKSPWGMYSIQCLRYYKKVTPQTVNVCLSSKKDELTFYPHTTNIILYSNYLINLDTPQASEPPKEPENPSEHQLIPLHVQLPEPEVICLENDTLEVVLNPDLTKWGPSIYFK